MLSLNKKISRDASHADTTWLGRLNLKVEEVFNYQIFWNWELLVEVTCNLSKEGHVRLMSGRMKRGNAFDSKIDFWSQNVGIGR